MIAAQGHQDPARAPAPRHNAAMEPDKPIAPQVSADRLDPRSPTPNGRGWETPLAHPHAPSRRRRWLLPAVAITAATAGVFVAVRHGQAPKAPQEAATSAFWRHPLVTLDGASFSLDAFRGQALLVNFWATWCPPCVDELPLIDRFYAKRSANSGQFLAVALDKTDAVRTFLARHPLAMPVALAPVGGLDLAKSLGNLAGGLPFTAFFRADGRLERSKLGVLTELELQAWIS